MKKNYSRSRKKTLPKKVQTNKKQSRPEGSERINKVIAASGYASRRQADELIKAGRVTIDGQPAQLGSFVFEHQSVAVSGVEIKKASKKVYFVFNKPEGVECTTDINVKDNIIDYLGYPQRIFPIGRLDKGSEGLLLLTNDGNIVNPILRAEGVHEKEYIVTVNKIITPEFLEKMASGVRILRQKTLPAKVQKLNDKMFKIILVQGLNRQIRRMTEALGYKVLRLQRIRIMNIELGKLKVGTYRSLTAREKQELFQEIGYK